MCVLADSPLCSPGRRQGGLPLSTLSPLSAASSGSPLFRKATEQDLDAITAIYDRILALEEAGSGTTGWVRHIYPTRDTALTALKRDDLFVQETDGQVTGAAVLNQLQVDVYKGAPWQHAAPDEKVMVLHTLVIDPLHKGKGLGRAFVRFYEDYALQQGCPFLRMDTNARNLPARAFYKKLNYQEIAIVPCVFNGIADVQLVLLEKKLSA